MKTLITGGIKSGKSFYALKKAREREGKRGFIATAMIKDDEMAKRVKEHRRERGTEFETIEEPYELVRAVKFADKKYAVTVVDCLNMWLLNLMEEKMDIAKERENLIATLKNTTSHFIIVTNEVSSGVVPADEYTRRFVEELSILNAGVAGVSDEVVLMVAGCPLYLKGEKN